MLWVVEIGHLDCSTCMKHSIFRKINFFSIEQDAEKYRQSVQAQNRLFGDTENDENNENEGLSMDINAKFRNVSVF